MIDRLVTFLRKTFSTLISTTLVLASIYMPPERAAAFTFLDGQHVTCRSYAGQAVAEITLPVSMTGYTGTTNVLPGGGAVIIWDASKLNRLPPAAHDFIYFHECAHANLPSSDELQANCGGLVDMRKAGRAGPAVEQAIGAFHTSLGFMGPRYGVGSVYWAQTVACANRRGPRARGAAAMTSTPPGMSLTCQFLNGPRSGQIQSYAGVVGVQPIPVGAPCTDGQGSMGTAIAAALPGGGQPTLTLTCQFTQGPRAGQTQSYAGVPGIQPIPIGAPCQDGQGSSGVAH